MTATIPTTKSSKPKEQPEIFATLVDQKEQEQPAAATTVEKEEKNTQQQKRRKGGRGSLDVVFAASLTATVLIIGVVYMLTVCPTAAGGDSGELLTVGLC